MTAFSRKPVTTIVPLGAKLCHAREEMGYTLENVAGMTSIAPKFLRALEDSRYRDLPGNVYVRNFLRSYAHVLHLPAERVLGLYEQERRVIPGHRVLRTPPRALPEPHAPNIPRIARNVSIVLGILLLLTYFGNKLRVSLEPPALAVTAPSGDVVVADTNLLIEGSTEPESTVRINGQEIFLDAGGHFSERIDLQSGLNIIKIVAAKERGREQIVERRVIVERTPADQTLSQTTEYQP